MASVQPVLTEGPPMTGVKHIFFKSHPAINYFSDEAEAEGVQNDVAFEQYNRSLECSNKFGCLMFSFNGSFYLLRVNDIIAAQRKVNADSSGPLLFKNLLSRELRNDFLPVTPNIITLSSDEEYLAVDTVRGDSAWVVVFNLAEFVSQGGACRPFCEIRCSSSSRARISAICWNPGENMNTVLAINVDDGSLFLAKIKGASSVELSRFPDGGIRCLCWSPKGKQLVVGRVNGSLSQLKLDLTEAKPIPGPEPNSIPISILWTQTTQFLVVFQKESYIDFMQLDLSKTSPPVYRNSGDIFVSDVVPAKSSCFFVPFVQWNAVLAMTNSASDVVTLVKEIQNQIELWTPGDVADNRRAAFLLDNYARGTAVYYGCEDKVVFSETESYPQMPLLFLLSQRGSISVYSVVNAEPEVPSLHIKVTSAIPDSIFSANVDQKSGIKQQPQLQQMSATTLPPQPAASSLPKQPLFQSSPFLPSTPPAVTPPVQTFNVGPNQPDVTLGMQPKQGNLFSQKPDAHTFPQPQLTQRHPSFSQQSGPRQLATSTLPSAQDMAVLQKAVEEKRREMTSQLFKGSLKGLEDDDQCAFVISEVRKFEERLASFISTLASNKHRLNEHLSSSFSTQEKNVLTNLNVVEDFVSDMVSTTSAQKEEVEVLKERILNHFSQLEYAKSIVERSRDPRYLEHLRSRPLDPASQQKFQEIRKLHNYVTNQVAECRRYFYEQNRKKETAFDRISLTQLIYLTLSNHSQIIRRLTAELDKIKLQLGLGKHITAFDEAEFLAVCDASYNNGNRISSKPSGNNEDLDEITLTDLTAGISRVKLNRDSERADRKPIRLANKKLLMLKKCMPDVSVIKIKADEVPWSRSPSKLRRPKPIAATTLESSFSQIMESTVRSEFGKSPLQSTAAAGSIVGSNFSSFASLSASETSSMTKVPGQPLPSMNTVGFVAASPSTVKTNLGSGEPAESSHFSPKSLPKSPTSVSGVGTKPFTQPNFAQASMAKSPVTVNISPSVVAPSVQHPTLAGLLSTPASSQPVTSISASFATKGSPASGATPSFVSTGISFGNPATAGGLFGTGTLSFGGTPPNAPVEAKPTSVATTTSVAAKFFSSPPVQVISSGSTALPVASATNAPVNFSSTFKSPTVVATGTPPTASNVGITNISTSGTTSIFGSTVPTSTKVQAATPPPLVPFGAITTAPSSIASMVKTTTSGPGLFSAPVVSSTSSSGLTITPVQNLSGKSENQTDFAGATKDLGFSSLSFTSPGKEASIFGSTAPPKPAATGVISTTAIPNQPSSLTSPGAPTLTVSPLASTTSVPSNVTVTKTSTEVTASQATTTTVTPGLFSSSTSFTSPATTTSGIFGGSMFGTSPNVSGGLFSTGVTSATTTPPTGLFSSTSTVPSTTSSPFSPANTTTTTTGTGLFSTGEPISSPSGDIFSTSTATTTLSASGGLFSSTPAVTTSTGLFSTATTSPPSGFFSPATSAVSTASGQAQAPGFLSSLSISDPSNKPSTPATTSAGGLFSTPTFGTSATTTSSIFGGSGTTFGAQTTSGIFGGSSTLSSNPQNQSTFGFSQAKPATTVFGSPTSPATGPAVFGGSATFGTSSPFGSSFGGTSTASSFGGGGVFGSTATTSQTSGFGAIAQSSTTSAFGSSPFGSGQQQASIFGTPSQPKPAAGGLFSSTFGSPASQPSGSIFGGGGGGSLFGGASASSGAFSAGANSGGVAQQGFGLAQTKPSTGSGFGSPPNASAVFGGGATFGSTSPFGSSFGASPSSTFGSAGTGSSNVFGGAAAATQTAGFGGLAQQGSTSPGFGGAGFGTPQPQPQSSVFGSASPQQQSKPTFGGQAFSSWR